LNNDVPALRHFSDKPPLEEIIKAAKDAIKDNNKLARQAGIYLCHKYSGASLKDIASMFGVGITAVGEASKQFTKKMEEDKSLRILMANAIRTINKWIMES
jgi:NADP-dependent 3-hydroxy acid dehydrogenase YdfG